MERCHVLALAIARRLRQILSAPCLRLGTAWNRSTEVAHRPRSDMKKISVGDTMRREPAGTAFAR